MKILNTTAGICQLAVVAVISSALWIGRYILSKYDGHETVGAAKTETGTNYQVGGVVSGGHWEYDDDISPPYTFSPQVCKASYIHKGDCDKTITCPSTLMNWIYIGNDEKPYPRFDVNEFRRKMKNRRIVFVGPSMVRQQVQALVWSLDHENVQWDRSNPNPEYLLRNNCTAARACTTDAKGNITICHQFMGSMATQVYHEGNYTLDHSVRGHGDSSCLLHDEMIADLSRFDLVFVQTLAWWTNLNTHLGSPSSPSEWILKMTPTVYYDAVGNFLSEISQRTETVFVLGQTGTKCRNKTEPEPFSMDDIAEKYGWSLAPKLWNTSLAVIQEKRLDVQVVDARQPLMQSVHAHPSLFPDCLHFCMNSAAVNIYLDMYWNEVFSSY